MNPETTDNVERNVIILWNYLDWGGAQIYLLSIVKHAPGNWNFKLVVPKKSPPEIVDLFKSYGAAVEYQNVSLDTSRALDLSQKVKRQWSRIRSELVTLRYIVKQRTRENTVLHIETAPWQSWLFIKFLTDQVDVFVTMHNSLPVVSRLRQRIWKFRLRYVSKLEKFHLFTSNQNTKDSLKGWVTEDFWRKIKVTYTCVDPSEIEAVLRLPVTKTDLRRKYSIEENKFVILCVGQFIDRKGRKIYLEAARKLFQTEKNLQFLWLTQTEITAADLELIESYRLGESFRLIRSETLGRERTDVLKFFRIADAFALPSFVEGLPIALLEAMALGLPSVSTDVNAIPEAIRPDETGLLIRPGSSDELAAAIKRLVYEPDLRTRLAERGKQHVVRHFDERDCARIVLESYEAALGNRK